MAGTQGRYTAECLAEGQKEWDRRTEKGWGWQFEYIGVGTNPDGSKWEEVLSTLTSTREQAEGNLAIVQAQARLRTRATEKYRIYKVYSRTPKT